MQRQLPLVAALAVLISAGVAAASHADPATGAKAMVLTLKDLPARYDLAEGRYVSNAELKSKNPAWKNYQELGRITGYNASYTTLGIAGLTQIDAFASIYKTGAGAHNSLVLTLVQARELDGTKVLVTKPGLLGGDVLVYRMRASGSKVDRFAVAWRRGSVFAEVIGGGLLGTIDAADVIALAKKQDSRMAKALQRS